jgi:EpsI family protein
VKVADQRPPINLEALFPKTIGAWRIDESLPVILPAPDVQAKLDKIYNQVLSRTYVNPDGARIMLSVAYGGDQSDGTNAHRPEVCYPAQGFQISGNRRTLIQLSDGDAIAARHLMSQLGTRFEPITYWIIVGDTTVTSGVEQKMVQLSYGIRGLVPDGMLVRVSSIERDPERGFALQRAFIGDLAKATNGEQRHRIFGDSAKADVVASSAAVPTTRPGAGGV